MKFRGSTDLLKGPFPYKLLLATDKSFVVVSPSDKERSVESSRDSVAGMVVLTANWHTTNVFCLIKILEWPPGKNQSRKVMASLATPCSNCGYQIPRGRTAQS
jgi:hypothetical protein